MNPVPDALAKKLFPTPQKIALCEHEKNFDARDFSPEKIEFCAPEKSRSREYFCIEISAKKIKISAFPQSKDWALDLLAQILAAFPQKRVSAMKIEDWPDLPTRGFMLDISRGRVPTEAELLRLAELLHRLRFNQLQLYTEHTFAFKNHEIVWQNASPLTPKFVQKFDKFCRSRHIELVPNLNSFGHVERWLKHAPYRDLAECPDGFFHELAGTHRAAGTFAPSEKSADFMAELYAEFLPNFSSQNFNIGGDEPWELGLGKSKEICRSRGKREVYVEHMLRLKNRAEKFGKKIMFWADVLLEENAKSLPKNFLAGTVPVIWGYEKNHPFNEQCARVKAALPEAQKSEFLLAAGTSAWLSFLSRGNVARENIFKACKAAKKFGAKGILLTTWGDNGYYNAFSVNYPALIEIAGTAWKIGKRPLAGTKNRAQLAKIFGDCGNEKIAGTLAKTLYDATKIDDLLSLKIPNRSALHSIFFAKTAEAAQKISEKIPPNELENVEKILEKLAGTLEKLAKKFKKKNRGNAEFWNVFEELNLALTLEKCALIRAKTGAFPPEKLLEKFRETWLLRNCPGGLDEACTFFPKK